MEVTIEQQTPNSQRQWHCCCLEAWVLGLVNLSKAEVTVVGASTFSCSVTTISGMSLLLKTFDCITACIFATLDF